jgi:hypothetical protein
VIFVDTGFILCPLRGRGTRAARPGPGALSSFEEQLEAFTYLKQHQDKGYSAVDCLSFASMLKLGIQEAWSFDSHFSHRFIVRPGSAE